MSLNAAALKLMADKGLSAHDVAEIAAACESTGDSVADRRRAWDRERKREQRGVGRLSGGMSGGNPPDPSPNERDILTPTRENPEPNGSVKKIRGEEKLKAVGTCLELPEWMPASFVEFRAMRKAMRNVPFGEGAERRVIAKITSARAEGHDPEKLLSKAIENGHRTVFPDENTKAAAGQVKQTSAEQISNLKRAIELYSRTGRRDLVSDARKRIEELEGGRPPPQVAQFARGLRA